MEATKPDQGYAYVILFASFSGGFLIYGISYTMGVFYNEFHDAFYDANTSIALLSSLHTALLFVIGPVSSILTNRFGPQVVCFMGGVCSGFAFAASMFSQSMYMLYVTFGALSGIGLGMSYIPVVTIVPYYFVKRRSLAVGFATSGGGFANLTLPPLVEYLISQYGWRGTCLLLGGAVLHLCVIGLLLRPAILDNTQSDIETKPQLEPKEKIKVNGQKCMHEPTLHEKAVRKHMLSNPKEGDSSVYISNSSLHKNKMKFDVSGSILSLQSIGKTSLLQAKGEVKAGQITPQKRNLMNIMVLKNPSYLLLGANNLCIMFGVIMVYVHLPAFAVSIGFSSAKGSLLLSFVGVGKILGHILSGMLAEVRYFSDTGIYVLAYFISGFTIALTPFVTNYILLCVISAFFGFFYGTMCALLPQVIIKILDVSLIVSGYGYLLIFEAVGTLSGPPIAESLFHHFGNYISSFSLAGATFFTASLLMLYPWWKIHKSDGRNKETQN